MDPVGIGIDPAHASLQLLVNQWVEAFNAHDVSSIVALYADDAQLFDSGMKHPRRGRFRYAYHNLYPGKPAFCKRVRGYALDSQRALSSYLRSIMAITPVPGGWGQHLYLSR
jgi:hypothetical protein